MNANAFRRALILTALPVEHEAVLSHLDKTREERHPRGTIYRRGTFISWDILIVEIGPGNATAAQETERAITHMGPEVAFFVGVAGGLKDVELGDVVAATKVYRYESGVDGQSFQARPDIGICSYPLIQEARVIARQAEWQKRARLSKPFDRTPRAFLGPIAAGEKVVKASSGIVATLVRSTYGDALAVEMEGSGFLRAAYANSVDAMIVRGISDLLDNKAQADASGSQHVASEHAAAFAFELLSNLGQRTAMQIAEFAAARKDQGNTADNDVMDVWSRLQILAPRLYPRGPDEGGLWEGAGGDVSRLDLSGNGRTQWSRAIRLLQNGGGGAISLDRLLGRMIEDYQQNYELLYLNKKNKGK